MTCFHVVVCVLHLYSHATHARVGDNELDGDGPRARNRGDVEGLIVNATDDQAECLADGVQRAEDIEYPFRIAGDGFGDGDSSSGLLSDLVDMGTSAADDNTRVLRHDQRTHGNLLSRGLRGLGGGSGNGGGRGRDGGARRGARLAAAAAETVSSEDRVPSISNTHLSRVEDSSIFSFLVSDLVGDAEDASRARLAVLSERGEGDAGRLAVAEDESVIGGAKAQRGRVENVRKVECVSRRYTKNLCQW